MFDSLSLSATTLKALDGILTEVANSLATLELSSDDQSQTVDHFISFYHLVPFEGANPPVNQMKVTFIFIKFDQHSWETVMKTKSASITTSHFDFDPINDADLECLTEVREVLKKYGKRERFGVTLLHKHFDIAEDEILVETTDAEARLLTIKPMKKDCVGNTVETTWMLLDGENRAMLGCRTVCSPNIHGNHHPFHQST